MQQQHGCARVARSKETWVAQRTYLFTVCTLLTSSSKKR